MSILLHEIYKFLNFAGASNFMFMRLGTSGVCSYSTRHHISRPRSTFRARDVTYVISNSREPIRALFLEMQINVSGQIVLSRFSIALAPVRYSL
jgi:hypothetical protein